MTPHDPHGPHDVARYRVIDAEPINDNDRPQRALPGFKLGVLVGLLVGVWVGFLARLAWLAVS